MDYSSLLTKLYSTHSTLPWLRDRTILLGLHGSHAYGTNIATSDIDVKGVAVPPKEYFLGFNRRLEQAECHDPDAVIPLVRSYELNFIQQFQQDLIC